MTSSACSDVCERVEKIRSERSGSNLGVKVNISSSWYSMIRWQRNRVYLLGDSLDNLIGLTGIRGENPVALRCATSFNQIDDTSLREAVNYCFDNARGHMTNNMAPDVTLPPPPPHQYPKTAIWSEATYVQTDEERVAIVRDLTDSAEQSGMLSAGDIVVSATGYAGYSTGTTLLYAPVTATQCSITVRDPDGTGSGWAGRSSYDWNRFDARALAATALDKCLRSRNPVRIEPGRYTTILEPQATFDFVIGIMFGLYGGLAGLNTFYWNATSDLLPYHEPPEEVIMSRRPDAQPMQAARTKIGQRLLDERVTLSYTPEDPDLGVLPFHPEGGPVRATTFFERGVLKQLSLRTRNGRQGTNAGDACRMSGGSTSIEEMIATTKRGLIVTRLSGFVLLDAPSLLYNGYTRDGLWLIENGKISRPVHNMRFTESPLFALNNLEQLGTPMGVFSPGFPAVVPPIKVRDFSFTALIDAV